MDTGVTGPLIIATEDYGVEARRLTTSNVIEVDDFPDAVGSDGSTEKCDAPTPVPPLGSGFSLNTWVAAFELQYVLTNVVLKAASPNSNVLLTSLLVATSILDQQEFFSMQKPRPGLQTRAPGEALAGEKKSC